MCKTAWLTGWALRVPWAIPIQSALEQERFEALAKAREAEAVRQAEADAVRARAQAAAIKAHEQEAQMVVQVRGAAIGVLNLAIRTLQALVPVFEHYDIEIKQSSLDVFKKAELMRGVSLAVQRAAIASVAALEAQRKHIGAPDHVLKIEGLDSNASDESIMEELRAVVAIARRTGVQEIDVGGGASNGADGANGHAAAPSGPVA